MTTSVRKFARHDTYLSFYIPMAYVIGAMYPAHRKDADILASHRLMADIRNYMVSSTGYDEKKRLREAIAKVQKAINDRRSEPPAPFRDPFVYVSDEKVRTVVDGKQPEPQDVNIDELQSVHHAAQGPGPKQEPVIKGGKGKGKEDEKGGPFEGKDDSSPKGPSRRGRQLQLLRRRALRLRGLSPRRRSELTRRLRSRRRRGAETMLPTIVGARLKSKRGKENLVGIRRCLQRNQRSGRYQRDPTMLTAGQVRRRERRVEMIFTPRLAGLRQRTR